MVEYSHLERSAVCASPGYYVGRKGSEVQIADGSGNLYGGGTQIATSAGQLYQAGKALTLSVAKSGYGYFKTGPTISAGSYRIAAGSSACSLSCTIDTGLTACYHAIVAVMGKTTAGTIATLDTPATPDGKLYRSSHPAAVQWRISGNDLVVKIYKHQKSGISFVSTLDGLAKYHRISWFAMGT